MFRRSNSYVWFSLIIIVKKRTFIEILQAEDVFITSYSVAIRKL